jgi:60 kDa SS-A/Ro ribonucleoprotein
MWLKMSKFNQRMTLRSRVEGHPQVTRNAEGGTAFTLSPLMDLYLRSATAMMSEQTFYKDAQTKDSELVASIHRVAEIDPEFVLKLALYVRSKLYLRSATTTLIGEFANSPGVGKVRNARKYVANAIQRPDDMTELIAYCLSKKRVKGKLPMMVKNGIARAFSKFDEYRLAKYNRDGAVKLRDAMFLTHPKPAGEEQAGVWQRLIDGKLAIPETWETQRSAGRMNWSQVLNDVFYRGGKTNNYMAIIRNCRNIIMSPDVTAADRKLLAQMIKDPVAIKYSKMLPFRFFSAYSELRKLDTKGIDISEILMSLEEAAQISIGNLPRLPGTTVIAIDTSGSMEWVTVSEKSTVKFSNISVLLGMMARKICDTAMTCTFDSNLAWKNLPDKDILRNAHECASNGGATYGSLVLRDLIARGIKVDRIIFLTDMVLYENGSDRDSFAELWLKYHQQNPGCKLYNIDLAGYGNTTIAEDMGARTIGGWSDKVLEFITILEKPEADVIDEIRKMGLP